MARLDNAWWNHHRSGPFSQCLRQSRQSGRAFVTFRSLLEVFLLDTTPFEWEFSGFGGGRLLQFWLPSIGETLHSTDWLGMHPHSRASRTSSSSTTKCWAWQVHLQFFLLPNQLFHQTSVSSSLLDILLSFGVRIFQRNRLGSILCSLVRLELLCAS